MTPDDLQALGLTCNLAVLSTLLLMFICIPTAWWLARSRGRLKIVVEAVVTLPLVLPPTVLGFYLLLALGPHGPLGKLSALLGGPSLVFNFNGLLIGSVVYSLPFVLQPLVAAFASIERGQLEAAATLRASPLDRFFSVVLPLSWPGMVSAAVLGFAHTLGEFGIVLMMGGNIPGSTRLLSIAIYDHVEGLDFASAHRLSATLLAGSFVMLLIVTCLKRRSSIPLNGNFSRT